MTTAEMLGALIPVATAAGAAGGRWLRGRVVSALLARLSAAQDERISTDEAHAAQLETVRAHLRAQLAASEARSVELERRLEESELRRRERDDCCRDCAHIHECAWRMKLSETGRDVTGQIPRDTVARLRAEFKPGGSTHDDDPKSGTE